jgi:exoribonuclease-2
MYFYKRGKGRYRKARPRRSRRRSPRSTARSAKASSSRMARRALRDRLPDALRAKLPMLLYKPDKNALEWKALAAACDDARTTPLALLARCGAIPSSHDYHFNAFLAQAFPQGTAFAAYGALPDLPELPVAEVSAFSIDDATTTEIDDAFSVRTLPNGGREIGIHIAAPALVIPRGSPLDAIARARLSTVYMPGRKITMLPEPVVAAFTLAEGRGVPSLSLYAEVTPEGRLIRHSTRVERVRIAANLRSTRSARRSPANARQASRRGPKRLRALWQLARRFRGERGKADFARVDYSFYVDWDEASGDDRGRARAHRPAAAREPARQARLGADDLRQQQLGQGPCRCRGCGALPHAVERQGQDEHAARRAPGARAGPLPVGELAASPLQRSRQSASAARGARRREAPVRGQRCRALRGARDFEATYSAYARIPEPDGALLVPALAVAGGRDEATGPSFARTSSVSTAAARRRLPEMPALAPDTQVRIAIARIDLVEATFESRYLGKVEGG